jgi:molybdenum cofactor cytidylyltransferase
MTAIVILAAGPSSRFGSPKQNANYKGETLLQLAVNNALAVSETVLIVLGANRELIEFSIKDKPVDILYNSEWTEGMASSIRLAVNKLQSDYLQITSALFMLCDQPYVDKAILQQLLNAASNSEKGIIASTYNDTLGAPVVFKSKYFPYLLALKGTEGAKKLIMQHADDVQAIPFPLGSVDIDTVEDYEGLI